MVSTDLRFSGPLDEDGGPQWLFDTAIGHVIAANEGARAHFGEGSLFALAERGFAPDEPFVTLACAVREANEARVARIAFPALGKGVASVRAAPLAGSVVKLELLEFRGDAARDPEERRLAQALRALPAAVILSGSGGRVLFANEVADRLTDRSHTLTERLGAEAAEAMATALASQGQLSRALDLSGAGGKRRCHVEARRLQDGVSGTILDVVTLRDLAPLLAVEQALVSERDAFRRLLALGADFLWESDPEGRIRTLSPSFSALTGRPRESLVGRRWYDGETLFEAEPGSEAVFAQAPDRFQDLALRLDGADGAKIELRLSGRALKDADGRFLGYAGLGRLAPTPQSATPVDARLRLLLRLLEATADAVLVCDGTGVIRYANHAAQALLGASREALIGSEIARFFGRDSRAAFAESALPRLLGGGTEVTLSGAHVLARPARLRVRPLDKDGMLAFVLSDLGAEKEALAEMRGARDRAEAAERRKTEFLARVSHELRTPLNAVIGFSEIMAREELGPMGNARYRGYVGDILHSSRHMLSLVNDLIDMAQLESGGLALKFGRVDLAKIVRRVQKLMEPAAREAKLRLNTHLARETPAVFADERSIEQVLLNLVSNAVKFTGPGGQVAIVVETLADGGVSLSVRDTGIGMSAPEIEIALEPFRRVESAAVRAKPGSGLGLPLAKALTAANHAEFRISSAPLTGTVVEVAFPRARLAGERG